MYGNFGHIDKSEDKKKNEECQYMSYRYVSFHPYIIILRLYIFSFKASVAI